MDSSNSKPISDNVSLNLFRRTPCAPNLSALPRRRTLLHARPYPIKPPGDVNSRGDWLAVALKDAFRTEDGTFDLTAFSFVMKNNGVTPPKRRYGAPRGDRSFRMCTGLRLRRHAAKARFCSDRRQENLRHPARRSVDRKRRGQKQTNDVSSLIVFSVCEVWRLAAAVYVLRCVIILGCLI